MSVASHHKCHENPCPFYYSTGRFQREFSSHYLQSFWGKFTFEKFQKSFSPSVLLKIIEILMFKEF